MSLSQYRYIYSTLCSCVVNTAATVGGAPVALWPIRRQQCNTMEAFITLILFLVFQELRAEPGVTVTTASCLLPACFLPASQTRGHHRLARSHEDLELWFCSPEPPAGSWEPAANHSCCILFWRESFHNKILTTSLSLQLKMFSGSQIHWLTGSVSLWFIGSVIHWFTGSLTHWLQQFYSFLLYDIILKI